jgi:hypothetical protein
MLSLMLFSNETMKSTLASLEEWVFQSPHWLDLRI